MSEAPASLMANDQDVSDVVPSGIPGVNINIHTPTAAPPEDKTANAQNPWSSDTVENAAGNVEDWLKSQASEIENANSVPLGQAPPEQQAMNMPSQEVGKVASLGDPMAAVNGIGPQTEQTSQPLAPMAQAPAPVQKAQAISHDLKSEDMATQHDLDMGHITPKTYADLFHDKTTLGKIGTIFGLLMSGAGAGLSRQPNMLMQMMDNTIKNDLEGQKASQDNKMNLLKINQQTLMNKYQVNHLNAETNLQAYTLANMQANRMALHSLVDKANQLPIGSPERAKADQLLGMISQGVQSENFNLADRAAAASSFLNMGQQSGQQMNSSQDVDFNRMNLLERMSQAKVPGAPSSEDLQNMTKEATHLQEVRALRKDFNNAFDSLDKSFLAGKLSPNQRESYVNSLAGKLAKVSAGRYNAEEAKAQINAMVPKSTDWGGTRDVKRQNNDQFFNIEEAGTPTLERFGIKKSVPHGTSGSLEGKTASDSKGNKIIMKNGRWVPFNG